LSASINRKVERIIYQLRNSFARKVCEIFHVVCPGGARAARPPVHLRSLKCSNQSSIGALIKDWRLELFPLNGFHAPVFLPVIGFKLGLKWLYLGLNGFVFYRQNHHFYPVK